MEYLYIDVLPERTAEEVGGFSREATRARGFALAMTWDTAHGFRSFTAAQGEQMIELMQHAECVVGYNCKAFDFEILQFYPTRYCDLLIEIRNAATELVPLTRAFRNFGTRPVLSSGIAMANRWRLGKRAEVITAFSRHVGAIRRLHQHILEHGWVLYQSWDGNVKKAQVEFTATVRAEMHWSDT